MKITDHAWPRRVDPVLLVLAVAGVTAALLVGSGIGGRPLELAIYWPLSVAFEIVMIVNGCRIWHNRELPGPHRRMWGSMALSGACYAIGVLLQLPTVLRHPDDVAAAFGGRTYSVCVLTGSLLVIGALLTSPLGLRTRRERLRFWLDTSTVLIAAATIGSYFTLLSNAANDTGSGAALQLLIGPAAFVVGVFAVIRLLLSENPPFTFWAGTLGLLGCALEGAVRGVRPILVQHGRIAWELAVTIVVIALLAASARTQLIQTRSAVRRRRRRPRRPYSLLPYATIAATYVLLIGSLLTGGLTGPSWVVVVGAVASSALVVGRQLSAFTDNARLLGALDAKVTELGAALAERDRLAAQLHHQAFHDPLTGLANRALFRQRLAVDAARAAVLLIDLDDFKPINDRFGHAAGDAVLVAVAERLRTTVRDGDLVARLGGDEFAVIIAGPEPGAGLEPGADPATTARRVITAIERPITLDTTMVTVSASVGVASTDETCDRAGQRPDDLLHRADLAMYAAKRAGRGGVEMARPAATTAS